MSETPATKSKLNWRCQKCGCRPIGGGGRGAKINEDGTGVINCRCPACGMSGPFTLQPPKTIHPKKPKKPYFNGENLSITREQSERISKLAKERGVMTGPAPARKELKSVFLKYNQFTDEWEKPSMSGLKEFL